MKSSLQIFSCGKIYAFLFAMLFIIHTAFSQQTLPARHTCLRALNTFAPSETLHPSPSLFRSNGFCDTDAVIDYNTYNEIIAVTMNLNYDGSWNNPGAPDIYAQEITRFIDTFHNYEYSYAGTIWDSMAFANYTQGTVEYFPLSASTIYLDSLLMFAGIWGDTNALDGTMTHDSLVFTIFEVENGSISPPVKTVVLSGYAGLEPFFHGNDIIGINEIPIHQQFSQGQGFAIEVNYLAKDTSSHFELSYSFADSCGAQYAAYPSMFAHDDVFWTNTTYCRGR